jgi:hypothetical protein
MPHLNEGVVVPDLRFRSTRTNNSTYFPLTARSIGEFDAVAMLG